MFNPMLPKKLVVYVSIGGGVSELLVTGPKWYDARLNKGGGGAIDLTMHLFRLDFANAVKRLQSALGQIV